MFAGFKVQLWFVCEFYSIEKLCDLKIQIGHKQLRKQIMLLTLFQQIICLTNNSSSAVTR